MFLRRFTLLMLLLLSLLPAMASAEAKDRISAHAEITGATKEQLSFSLCNDSSRALQFVVPETVRGNVSYSIVARTSDGLWHVYYRHYPSPPEPDVRALLLPGARDPFLVTAGSGEKIAAVNPLGPFDWPDLLADWPRLDAIALDYFAWHSGPEKWLSSDGEKVLTAPAASKPFPLTPEAGAETPEEAKVRIEIVSISRKKISIAIRNDSGREVSVFETGCSWGDPSFKILAEMKDGSLQHFPRLFRAYSRNFPKTQTIPAHQSGTDFVTLDEDYCPALLAAWDRIKTLTVCYGDIEFSDDPSLKAHDTGDFHEDAVITWPHSIGGVPKALITPKAASAKK